MKAIVRRRWGRARDVVELADIPKPEPADDEVLVHVAELDRLRLIRLRSRHGQKFHDIAWLQPAGRVQAEFAVENHAASADDLAHLLP